MKRSLDIGVGRATRAIAQRAEARPGLAVAALFALWLPLTTLLVWRPTVEAALTPDRIQHVDGHAYVTSLAGLDPFGYQLKSDTNDAPRQSDLLLLRNAAPVGEPHKMHADIRTVGNGHFSHWQKHLYFSTPGNSDPRSDGHRYTVRATAAPNVYVAGALVTLLVLLSAVTIVVFTTRPFASAAKRAAAAGVHSRERVAPWLGGARGCAVAFVVVLAVATVAATRDWSAYAVAPDTGTYLKNQLVEPSLRPPMVAAWVDLVSDRSAAWARLLAITQAGGVNELQTGGTDDPILKVVQAQRVVLAFACAVFAFVAAMRASVAGVVVGMSAAVLAIGVSMVTPSIALLAALSIAAFMPSLLLRLRGIAAATRAASDRSSLRAEGWVLLTVLALIAAAALFVDAVFQASYLSEEQHYLLSEPLAMAGQLLFAACAVAYLWRRSGVTLILAGLTAGLCYLTRSAAAFVLVAFGGLLVLAFAVDRRRAIAPASAAMALALLAVFAAPIASMLRGGPTEQTASLFNWGPVAFALEIARPEDAQWMPDDQSREFLVAALRLRDSESSMRRSAPPYRSLNLGENLYLAAMPAAAEALDLPRLTSGSMSVHGAAVNTLFGKMAWPILRHRADEYAGMVGESFAVATGLHPTVRATRLFSSPWHWAALGSLLVLTVAGRARDTKIALAGALLIGMHLLHLCIVVLFDVPLPRYVHATEIFVVLALVLLIDHHVRVVACAARANWRTLSAPTAEQVHHTNETVDSNLATR